LEKIDMLKIMLAASAGLVLVGCATSGEYDGKRADYSDKKTVETNAAGEELICRKKTETGSRLRGTKKCATQAEWDAHDENVRQSMKDMTNGRGTDSQ
jgi:hypothetical protein